MLEHTQRSVQVAIKTLSEVAQDAGHPGICCRCVAWCSECIKELNVELPTHAIELLQASTAFGRIPTFHSAPIDSPTPPKGSTNLAHAQLCLQWFHRLCSPSPKQLTQPSTQRRQRSMIPSKGPRTPWTRPRMPSPLRPRWSTRHCGRRRGARRTAIAAAQRVM